MAHRNDMEQVDTEILAQILDKARSFNDGDQTLSTGEMLAAALALNRPDVLIEMGYTLAAAIDRLGPVWLAQIPAAARQLTREREVVEAVLVDARRKALNDELLSSSAPGEVLRFKTELLTYGYGPGYRDASLEFMLAPSLAGEARPPVRAEIRIRPEDAESIVDHLKEVHRVAWRNGTKPLDVRGGETRPKWID